MYEITSIKFKKGRKVSDREVIVTLSNGTEIHITSCYESWEQWGGTTDELRTTVELAECVNDWLHGIGRIPEEVYDYISE